MWCGSAIDRGGAPIFLASLLTAFLLLAAVVVPAEAQRLTYSAGQPVFPAYEGWTERADGSLAFMFGYMNENWEETPNIPVGDENFFAPGPEDRGQPTFFLPRRNRFVFEVPVPEGFEEDDELVWTIEANGQEYSAYATLRQDYYVDNVVIMSETGALGAGTSSPEMRANEPPVIDVESETRMEARVGEPVRLVARVTDDGQPSKGRDAIRSSRSDSGDDSDDDGEEGDESADGATDDEGSAGAPGAGESSDAESGDEDADPTPREKLARALRLSTATSTVSKRLGLHLTWFPYRGPDGVDLDEVVVFDPPQTKPWEDTRPFANSPWAVAWEPPELPEDGRWTTEVTFEQPGIYVLRGRADDGGLYSDVEVTIEVVRPSAE
ncbi:MAG: hypothetical protein ACOC8K_09475 [Gemmatimonadota bacterium]